MTVDEAAMQRWGDGFGISTYAHTQSMSAAADRDIGRSIETLAASGY